VNRWEVRLLHVANLLVGATGLLYAWLRYFAAPADEFSPVHPWQPWAQHAHVLTAPLLLFALGLFWRAHALSGLRSGAPERRRTGITLLAAAAPMALSGYLLQTAVDPAWRTAWIAIHLASSALWLVATVVHLLQRRRRR
jgi:hypothetical protein